MAFGPVTVFHPVTVEWIGRKLYHYRSWNAARYNAPRLISRQHAFEQI
jgi:hypothetical protein